MRRAEILCFESRVIDQQCYHVDREPGSVTLIVQSRISGHIYVVSVLASLSVGGGTVPSTYRHDPFQACSHICYQLPVMEGNTSCRCYMRVPKKGSEISLNFLDEYDRYKMGNPHICCRHADCPAAVPQHADSRMSKSY